MKLTRLVIVVATMLLASCMKNATVDCYTNGRLMYHTEGATVISSESNSILVTEKDGTKRAIKGDCIVTEKK